MPLPHLLGWDSTFHLAHLHRELLLKSMTYHPELDIQKLSAEGLHASITESLAIIIYRSTSQANH